MKAMADGAAIVRAEGGQLGRSVPTPEHLFAAYFATRDPHWSTRETPGSDMVNLSKLSGSSKLMAYLRVASMGNSIGKWIPQQLPTIDVSSRGHPAWPPNLRNAWQFGSPPAEAAATGPRTAGLGDEFAVEDTGDLSQMGPGRQRLPERIG